MSLSYDSIKYLRKRFYLCMLTPYVLVFLLDVLYLFPAVITPGFGLTEYLFVLLIEFIWFAATNLIGIFLLFRSVEKALKQNDRDSIIKKVTRLPALATAWILFLGLTYSLTLITTVFTSTPTYTINIWGILRIVLPALYAFTIFIGYCTHLLMKYFSLIFRKVLYEELGILFQPENGKMWKELMLSFVVVAILPLVLLISDLAYLDILSSIAEKDMFVLSDFAVAFLGIIITLLLTTQIAALPIGALMKSFSKVRKGIYSTRAPVMTSNEIGQLTADFNLMAVGLEEREILRNKNTALYEELKLLDKARERVINHLSHELKTPLTIIMSTLDLISKKTNQTGIDGLDKAVARGQRNSQRLLDLQGKIDDIVNQRSVLEKGAILSIIESAADIVGELKNNNFTQSDKTDFLEQVNSYLNNLFTDKKIRNEAVALDKSLNEICDSVVCRLGERSLNIIRRIDEHLVLETDKRMLHEIFNGLLKNAIENTPDEGKIEVIADSSDDEIRVKFRDYGVGITAQNKNNVFGGFFHTQDTTLYSSKNHYMFNAGGTGADLLRFKAFSERYGFSIELETSRCKFIPNDVDICPGRISNCHHINHKHECYHSGGSTFLLCFSLNADGSPEQKIQAADENAC